MFAMLSVAKAVSLSMSLLLAALVLYASFQPSYAPLRSMVTERYLEAQGRAAWQVEQRRAAAEARERRRREAAFRKLVADGRRLMAEAERVAAQRLAEEERIRKEREERERQEQLAQEQERQKRHDRAMRRQVIDYDLFTAVGLARTVARIEITQVESARNRLPEELLDYFRMTNIPHSNSFSYEACDAVILMTRVDLYSCAISVYEEGENSPHRGAPEELLTLAVMIAHGDIDAGFSLSEYISYVLIKRATQGENETGRGERLPRTVLDMTRIAPSLTGRFIRDRLTFEDEQYLLNVTVKTLERIDALTSERGRLDY